MQFVVLTTVFSCVVFSGNMARKVCGVWLSDSDFRSDAVKPTLEAYQRVTNQDSFADSEASHADQLTEITEAVVSGIAEARTEGRPLLREHESAVLHTRTAALRQQSDIEAGAIERKQRPRLWQNGDGTHLSERAEDTTSSTLADEHGNFKSRLQNEHQIHR